MIYDGYFYGVGRLLTLGQGAQCTVPGAVRTLWGRKYSHASFRVLLLRISEPYILGNVLLG